MDLYKLDSQFKVTGNPIEGWSSLVWTERYTEPGDFVLVSPNIDYCVTNIPIESLLAINGSSEIMYVETHDIKRDEDGEKTITISGRTLNHYIDYRMAALGGTLSTAKWVTASLTAAECARIMLKTHFIDGLFDSLDIIPNLTITNVSTVAQTARVRIIERGQLGDRVRGVLSEEGLALRSVRPSGASSGAIWQIYNGTDRSATVILDVAAGHFDETSYLTSVKDMMTVCWVFTTNSSIPGPLNEHAIAVGFPSNFGLQRRTLLVDADDINEAAGTDWDAMYARGAAQFPSHDVTAVFDGTVSPNIPYKYGTDYFLGDLIKVLAEYKMTTKMQVSEYIRSEDENGIREYPTLSILS